MARIADDGSENAVNYEENNPAEQLTSDMKWRKEGNLVAGNIPPRITLDPASIISEKAWRKKRGILRIVSKADRRQSKR